MRFSYFAYGLKFSSEIELPELGGQIELDGDADFIIALGDVATDQTDEDTPPIHGRWLDPDHYLLSVENVAHYLISAGRRVTMSVTPGADPTTVRAFLLGSGCGALLLQRGFLVLHGNAIRIGDACMVCVGDSGAGKSTLAAAFLKRGFEVLADDVVAVDSTGSAIPGFPRIKLWQKAADGLGIPTGGLALALPDRDKYNLPITTFDPNGRLPIRWIYRLSADQIDSVEIEPVAGLQRFELLRQNTYRSEYIESQEMITNHLRQCSTLANQVNMAMVRRPESGFDIDGLIDRLLESCGQA